MRRSSMSRLSQQLQRIALAPDVGDAPDRELLERFLSRREEAAFAVLVRRHGKMVLGVCRRMLGDYHLAEDAFQATFLVLLRKAAAVRKRDSIASWLYGVAYRTARKARIAFSRRRSRERPMSDVPAREDTQPFWDELAPILDQELQRLPEIYRTALGLCDLGGKTRKEAARLVGCPEGTLSTRLMRARELLAKRLTRRGLTLSVGALELVLAQQKATAALPASLVAGTAQAATAVTFSQATGVISPQVAALTEGVLKTMLAAQCIKGAALVLTAGLLCAGLALPFYHGSAPGVLARMNPDQQRVSAQPGQRTSSPQDPLREKLATRIRLDKGIDRNTPAKDAFEFFSDRYDLKIEIDVGRFKAAGMGPVEDVPVQLPALFHVRLATLLRL